MSTETKATEDVETIEQIESLPWVADVRVTNREDATHVVLTRLGVMRRTHEDRELENCGATVEAHAPGYHNSIKAFVTI